MKCNMQWTLTKGNLIRRDDNRNGYPDSEDKAVDAQNDYSESIGESKRDDYGDENVDPDKREKPDASNCKCENQKK